MNDVDQPEGALGLADFLSDLRAELERARGRAEGDSLRLEVGQVTVALDIGVTLTTAGEVSSKASAKFWVFASAEASAKGKRSSEHVATQRLTLTMVPHVAVPVRHDDGREVKEWRPLHVSGGFAEREDLGEQ